MRSMKVFGFAVLAAAVALSFVGPLSAQTPTLLHDFKFDGDYTSQASSVVANPLWSYTPTGTDNGISGGAAYFNGVDSILLLEGNAVLPAGAVTLSFWEKAETPAGGGLQQGYYVCDAAGNPLDNLYLRRYAATNPDDPEGDQISTPNGAISSNNFLTFGVSGVSTDVWHQHTITYTESGIGYWYVDGQFVTPTGPGTPFAGLTSVKDVDPGSYIFDGLTIGNRLDSQRPYQGYMDEWQIYQGSAHGGMAQFLYDNPGATLDTFDAGAYPDPGLPGGPGARPENATVRRWKFDGDLNETDGTAHGTALGEAVAGTDNGAYAGSGAVAFDGTDDAVSIAAEVLPAGNFSVSLWSKDTAGTDGYLFCDSANVTNLLHRRGADGNYNSWLSNSAMPQYFDPETGEPVTFDEWHHTVMAVDVDWGMYRVFLDGQVVANRNYTSGWDGFEGLLSDFFLGNRADMGRDYGGLIDDLQIYNWAISLEDADYLFSNPGLTLLDSETPAPGDANGDGYVDVSDLGILATNYGVGSGLGWGDADFNGDGVVDVSDLGILATNYGATPAAQAVPEPGVLAMLVGAMLAAFVLRRRALNDCKRSSAIRQPGRPQSG